MLRFDPGSFRDPKGRVFYHEGRVFRTLRDDAGRVFDRLVASGLHEALVESGLLVASTEQDATALGLDAFVSGRVLEHERIPYVSYPYEWSFDMLRDAALLTLEIQTRSLEAGFTLQDATPFNVQYRSARPVFIDVLSFEPYEEGEAWVAYGQFCATFLFPLMLTAYRGLDFQPWLRASLSGIDVADMSKLFGWGEALRRRGVFGPVKLAAQLQRHFEAGSQEESRKIGRLRLGKRALLANLASLRKTIERMRYVEPRTPWTGYSTQNTYDEADRARKTDFVRAALKGAAPRFVWDLGCNTGDFSQLAAESGARVLSIDADPPTVNRLYLAQKRGERAPAIQPLVGDLCNPSPGLGWGLAERQPWLERGRPDFFLALALVHHLAIRGNVPLDAFVDFLRGVAGQGVVEFVDKSDPMVRRLLAGRKDVFEGYGREAFERALRERFDVVEQMEVQGASRALFALRPAAPGDDAG